MGYPSPRHSPAGTQQRSAGVLGCSPPQHQAHLWARPSLPLYSQVISKTVIWTGIHQSKSIMNSTNLGKGVKVLPFSL